MISPAQALVALPSGLRDPLIECFSEIGRNFAERRWEPAELNGGKFCEIVYTILDGTLSGSYAVAPAKPPNMVDACRLLEQRPPDAARVGDRSLRILIPRLLPVLYEVRNNRGVGHVGGDVDPNFQDAVAVYQMASWVMAELIRIFHQISIGEAQETVNALVDRKHPIIWQTGGIRRVLDPSLSKGDQSLLLLYSAGGWVEEKDLADWVEYSNLTQYRNRVIVPLHDSRHVEYDKKLRRIHLTPRGSEDVEQRLLPKYKP
jgi:hypothetical protein